MEHPDDSICQEGPVVFLSYLGAVYVPSNRDSQFESKRQATAQAREGFAGLNLEMNPASVERLSLIHI